MGQVVRRIVSGVFFLRAAPGTRFKTWAMAIVGVAIGFATLGRAPTAHAGDIWAFIDPFDARYAFGPWWVEEEQDEAREEPQAEPSEESPASTTGDWLDFNTNFGNVLEGNENNRSITWSNEQQWELLIGHAKADVEHLGDYVDIFEARASKAEESGNSVQAQFWRTEAERCEDMLPAARKRIETVNNAAAEAAQNAPPPDWLWHNPVSLFLHEIQMREAKEFETRYKQSQTPKPQLMTGLPPDATFFDRLNTVHWWNEITVSRFDEGRTAFRNEGTLTRVMVGGDYRIAPMVAVGLGIGYRNIDSDTVINTDIEADGFELLARGFWGWRSDRWFDTHVVYIHDDYDNSQTGVFSDEFDVDRIGFGAGINLREKLSEQWHVENRLGWRRIWSHRESSTDSNGIRNPSDSTHFERVTARARLVRRFEDAEIFGEAALRVVTRDSSMLELDDDPIDGVLGGGARARLGDHLDLIARAYVVVGGDDYDEYGGTLHLGLGF